jgi:hypothetical protein
MNLVKVSPFAGFSTLYYQVEVWEKTFWKFGYWRRIEKFLDGSVGTNPCFKYKEAIEFAEKIAVHPSELAKFEAEQTALLLESGYQPRTVRYFGSASPTD